MMVLLLALLAQTVPADQDSLTLESLRREAASSRLQDDPGAAEQFLLQAAPIAAKLYGDTSLELAALLSELSGVKRSLGKLTDAVLPLESALRMRDLQPAAQPIDDVNDLLRLAALDALAGSHRDQSEYAEAEPMYLRLLALRQATFGRDSAELISTLDSLAYVQFGMKRYDDGQPVYERLLALWESSAGPDHPMVALTLDKMAELFAAQERYAEAEPLAARSTAMRARMLIDSLARSGRILEAQAGVEEACDFYRRALLVADESKLEAPRLGRRIACPTDGDRPSAIRQ